MGDRLGSRFQKTMGQTAHSNKGMNTGMGGADINYDLKSDMQKKIEKESAKSSMASGGGRFKDVQAAAPSSNYEVKSTFAAKANKPAIVSGGAGKGRFAKIEKAAPTSSSAAPSSTFADGSKMKSSMAAQNNNVKKKDRFSYGNKATGAPDAGLVKGAFDVGPKKSTMGAATATRFKSAKNQGPVNESQAEVKDTFAGKAWSANASPAMMKAKPRFADVKESAPDSIGGLGSDFDKALTLESNMQDKRTIKKDRGQDWISAEHDKG